MTFNTAQTEFINRMLYTARIIFFGLFSGVVTFLAVVYLVLSSQPMLEGEPLVTYIATGVGMLSVVLALVVPRMLGDGIRNKLVRGEEYQWPNPQWAPPEDVGEVGPLMAHAMLRMIVSVAILEGAAFFNIVAFVLERQTLSLIVTALLLFVMLLKFPKRSWLENWLHDEMRIIEELRGLQKTPSNAR